MEDKAAIGLRLRRDGGRVARQVGKLHMRDRCQRLGAVRLLLERGKPLLLRDDLAALRLIQCFERFFKRCALPLLPFLAAGLRRAQEDFGGMRIFQQQAAQKDLFSSSRSSQQSRAPEAAWVYSCRTASSSSMRRCRVCSNPCSAVIEKLLFLFFSSYHIPTASATKTVFCPAGEIWCFRKRRPPGIRRALAGIIQL